MLHSALWPLWIVFFFLSLSGCSHFMPQGNTDTLQQQLDFLDHWQVRGKLAVNSQTDNGTGYLTWKQQQHEYDLYISGPFGAGASRLQGNQTTASLSLPGWKQPRTADSAEQLMANYLGWNFPVTGIRHWVKGQADPSASFEAQFNEHGLMEELHQYGWHIRFSRYRMQQGYWLPGLIKISGYDFKFTFAISQWTLF